MAEENRQEGQPGIGRAALLGLCPRCGQKTLFAKLTQFAPECSSCKLDFSAFNVGDGPAAFLTMVIGALIIFLAISFDVAVRPPFWVHLLIWIPVTTLMVIGSLRIAKAALLAAEHHNKAGEGQQKTDSE